MNKKYILSLMLSLFVFGNTVTGVYCAPDNSASVGQVTVTKDAEGDNSLGSHAISALLMDMKSGKILFSKNENKKMYPASTTKILTGIIALENLSDLGEVVIAPQEAIAPITNQHSHMGILIGEELTVEQLLYGMLCYSANDAANVLAIHIAGSIDAFTQVMNQKAAELGATGSHFVNPHGFHDDNHYTTAQDLALIAKYAMQNEKFREIVGTDMYTMPATNKYKEDRYLSSTNHLISNIRQYGYKYKKATGIKTGYTDEAGSCLVASAKDGETELLSVVMGCQNTTMVANGAYSFVDSKELLEYGFDNFKYITIAANGDIVSDSAVYEAKDNVRIALTPEESVNALLPKGIDLNEVQMISTLNKKIAAPISKGDVLGSLECVYNGETIGTSALIAANDVEKDYIVATIHLVIKIITHPVFIILLLLFIFLRIRAKRISDRKRQKRRSSLDHVDENADNYSPRQPRDKYYRKRR